MGMRADLLVKKLLAENYIGQPHHVRLQSFTSNYLDLNAPPHWRQRIELSGLNVLTLGIYVEVLQRWLGNIIGVFARGKIIYPIRQGYEVIIPDLLTVLCQFESGAEGVLEFSGVEATGSKFTAAPALSLTILVPISCRRASWAIAPCTMSILPRNWKANGAWKKIFSLP
jgi:predicted dehydrogenase